MPLWRANICAKSEHFVHYTRWPSGSVRRTLNSSVILMEHVWSIFLKLCARKNEYYILTRLVMAILLTPNMTILFLQLKKLLKKQHQMLS